MRYALSYAAQQVSGIWSWVRDAEHVEKAFDFSGMGARNGVTAAIMVQTGFTGVADVLDGEHNVLEALSTEPQARGNGGRSGQPVLRHRNRDQDVLRRLSDPGAARRVPDAAPRARPDADNVERIVVRLPEDGARIVNNRAMPDVNCQHIIAVALVDGSVSFEDSHSYERMEDPQVRAVKERVELVADRALMDPAAPRSGLVEVTLRDGRTVSHFTRHAPGTKENPLDTEGVNAKARDLMAPVLGDARDRGAHPARERAGGARRRARAAAFPGDATMMTMMQSYWMQMTDTETVLELRDTPVPEPGRGSCSCACTPPALNRGEFLLGHGLHGKPGTLEGDRRRRRGRGRRRRGRASSDFKRGDRVMGRCAGAFSEYALMEAAEAMAAPPALSWEEAASIPLTFLVAYDMLVLQGRLQPGEWLLINGVSSGVGVASLQLGKALGATRHRHVGLGREARGARAARPRRRALHPHSRTSRRPSWRPPDSMARTSSSTPSAARCSPRACAPWPSKAGSRPWATSTACCTRDIDLEALHAKRLTLFGVSNKLRNKEQRAAAVPRFVAEVLPLFAAGRIKPQIDRVMDFAQLARRQGAHGSRRARRQDRPAHAGRILTFDLIEEENADETHDRWLLALALAPARGAAWAQPAAYPEQADPAGDRLRAGRRGRLRGARDERRVRQGARPAGGGREQAGRRLEHRRGDGGQVAGRTATRC